MKTFDEIQDEINELEEQIKIKKKELKSVCPHEHTFLCTGIAMDDNIFYRNICGLCGTEYDTENIDINQVERVKVEMTGEYFKSTFQLTNGSHLIMSYDDLLIHRLKNIERFGLDFIEKEKILIDGEVDRLKSIQQMIRKPTMYQKELKKVETIGVNNNEWVNKPTAEGWTLIDMVDAAVTCLIGLHHNKIWRKENELSKIIYRA